MTSLFQCAPNFSEGRNPDTLDALRRAASAPGVALCDFTADPDHNRAVATLLGDAEGLERAVMQMAAVAVERIDLRLHAGQHPFVGALDVLPFVPFRNAAMDQADSLAQQAARRIGEELGVPVYLYAESAADPSRRALPALRKGGIAGLCKRMAAAPPDYGPPTAHPSAGITVAGARKPLLAFNVNLDSVDVNLAKRIARQIREANGGIPGVRALGLWLSSCRCAQVSVNITDVEAATLATVYRAVADIAASEGVSVRGCELIGGIALPYLVAALNEALRGEIRVTQVLDGWLPLP
ncbi:MAG TPA: glutamate formimidoyltransferase [Armatimonadota bacterium]|jgi:glutamate formiminotransferase